MDGLQRLAAWVEAKGEFAGREQAPLFVGRPQQGSLGGGRGRFRRGELRSGDYCKASYGPAIQHRAEMASHGHARPRIQRPPVTSCCWGRAARCGAASVTWLRAAGAALCCSCQPALRHSPAQDPAVRAEEARCDAAGTGRSMDEVMSGTASELERPQHSDAGHVCVRERRRGWIPSTTLVSLMLIRPFVTTSRRAPTHT